MFLTLLAGAAADVYMRTPQPPPVLCSSRAEHCICSSLLFSALPEPPGHSQTPTHIPHCTCAEYPPGSNNRLVSLSPPFAPFAHRHIRSHRSPLCNTLLPDLNPQTPTMRPPNIPHRPLHRFRPHSLRQSSDHSNPQTQTPRLRPPDSDHSETQTQRPRLRPDDALPCVLLC